MKPIYRFGELPKLKEQLGSLEKLSDVVGVKSANLSEVASIGLSVPDGIVLSSVAYESFVEGGSGKMPDDLWDDFLQEIKAIEQKVGLKYASPHNPLILSVRGDSSIYMVGMLDAVTHIGLNDVTARALERSSLNRPYVWDCYRRLIQGYGTVVLRIPVAEFDAEQARLRKARKLDEWTAFQALDFIELTKANKAVIVKKTGRAFPQDPYEQLRNIMSAVFASVSSERVTLYRKALDIGNVTGAILVSQMVFGNNNVGDMAVVAVSRDLVNGEQRINGQYCMNATCDDVSSGDRAIVALDGLSKANGSVHTEVTTATKTIEQHFKCPVIVDMIVSGGKLYCVEAVRAQATAAGRFKTAKDMVGDDIISKTDGLSVIEPADLAQMITPQLAEAESDVFCTGECAGRECIVGKVCLTPADVTDAKKEGVAAVYVKEALIPHDFTTFTAAEAVVTAKGNGVGFGAALSRLFRKTAAIGCVGLEIDCDAKQITCKGTVIAAGDMVTVTAAGSVLVGMKELKSPQAIDDINAKEVLMWADEVRKDKMFVFATADDAEGVKMAVDIESDGVGVFTIEKFFTGDDKAIITNLAKSCDADASGAFERHLTGKLSDVFAAGGNKAVTIRLFEPTFDDFDLLCPLEIADEIGSMKENGASEGDIEAKRALLAENNGAKPNSIIGCRGIRNCLANKEFMNAQFKAILNAAKAAKSGGSASPQIRILAPFVTEANEMSHLIKSFNVIAEEVGETANLGAQIETPRACLTSSRIVNSCDFIDISTPLITELTYAMHRMEAPVTFLPKYGEDKIFKAEIINSIPMDTVGVFIKKCITAAREGKEDAKVGMYHDDFENPDTLYAYAGYGINSFICQPRAVPLARLCAAKTLLSKD